MTRTASCACGKLTAACEGEPVRISICHCLDCQRRTGSAFGAAAFFPRKAVRTEGPCRVFERTADSGAQLQFHFCPDCGSTVFWTRSSRPDVTAVAIGAFADPAFPAPDKEVWQNRAHGWARFGLEEG